MVLWGQLVFGNREILNSNLVCGKNSIVNMIYKHKSASQ